MPPKISEKNISGDLPFDLEELEELYEDPEFEEFEVSMGTPVVNSQLDLEDDDPDLAELFSEARAEPAAQAEGATGFLSSSYLLAAQSNYPKHPDLLPPPMAAQPTQPARSDLLPPAPSADAYNRGLFTALSVHKEKEETKLEDDFCARVLKLRALEIVQMKERSSEFKNIISKIRVNPRRVDKIQELMKNVQEGGINFDFYRCYQRKAFREKTDESIDFLFKKRKFIREKISLNTSNQEDEIKFINIFCGELFSSKKRMVIDNIESAIKKTVEALKEKPSVSPGEPNAKRSKDDVQSRTY